MGLLQCVMLNILSQITLKSNFSGTKSSTAFSLHWWMTSHVFIQKMHYSLTSCQLYFLVPLSSFLAHLLALSHILLSLLLDYSICITINIIKYNHTNTIMSIYKMLPNHTFIKQTGEHTAF